MASCSKKPRIKTELDNLSNVDEYFCLKKERKREIAQVFDTLCFVRHKSPAVTLRPLKIVNCNAADDNGGVPFPKAYCALADTNKVFLLGDIFRRGLQIMIEFLKEGKFPNHKHEHYALRKFLRFINESEWDSYKVIEGLSEREITTLLANHLFGKLSISADFLMDKNCAGKINRDTCLCGAPDCRPTGNYGDTSIGNGEVWHGNVYIIVNNDLGIEPLEDKSDSPEEKSPVEVKTTSNLSRNAQIIAETIVFSFLQKKRHPENDHYLTPCIGVGSRELVIMFYDSEHDVLLESSRVPLLDTSVEGFRSCKFSLEAIMVSWLVVNYMYLCSGLTEDMKSSFKADFFVQAEKKIDVYKKDLKFQNVGTSYSSTDKALEKDNISFSEFAFKMHQEFSKIIFSTFDTSQ